MGFNSGFKGLNTGRFVISGFYRGVNWGTRWRSWLGHCSTSQKVAGPIPDAVIGIFH